MTGPESTLGITPEVDRAITRLAGELSRRMGELGASLNVNPSELLRDRARLLSLTRPGRTSANGHSRFLECRDAWIVLSLARPDDVDLLEALTGQRPGDDPWTNITRTARSASAHDIVTRGRLLGLPIAVVPREPFAGAAPIELIRRSASAHRDTLRGMRVVDLSSLWAGPLAARILSDAGAEVTKVESISRPDGARARPEFYATLHAPDQRCLVVDFATPHDIDVLRQEMGNADVVIEGSRPRALEHLGLGPEQVTPRPGAVWLSVTGYGRRAPGNGWVAFGDDGAAAGGLVTWSREGKPSFIGDAIADPLAGLFGALGVVDSLCHGGGHLVDVALQRSAAWVAVHGAGPLIDSRELTRTQDNSPADELA